jgi:hypothetical protein
LEACLISCEYPVSNACVSQRIIYSLVHRCAPG